LSRQKLPILDRVGCDGDLRYGAYVLKDMDKDKDIDLILIGTGSEVHICVEAAEALAEKGVNTRVVSMPSWELFEKAPAPYKERIFPSDVKARIAVEAGISMGWERYVGDGGRIIGIDRFGASAPGGKVLAEFGFTAENIVKNALELLKK
jgi:transketolase